VEFPLFVSVQKLASGHPTGNTMVFKPSPYTPLVDSLLAEILEGCDLPEGSQTRHRPERGAWRSWSRARGSTR